MTKRKQPESISDFWRKLLSEAPEPEPEVEPIEMTFDGIPARVRPLNVAFYIESGRMPDYLTRAALYAQKGDQAGTLRALDSAQIEEVVEGQKFQRMLVCKALEEPRVVDVLPGQAPEGCFSYTELAERRPAFVDGVKFWILVGCPRPVKEGEGEGLTATALQNFPSGKRRKQGSKSRRHRKADGKRAVSASEKVAP